MSKDMMIALGGGALSGLISLAFVAGLPGAMVAVYLTPLPLFMIGLGLGLKSETVAGISGVITATIIGGPLSGLLFALIYALPVWLVVRLAMIRWQVSNGSGATKEEWMPTGNILGMLAILAAALFALAYILALGQEGGMQGMIESILDRVFSFLMPGLQDGDRAHMLGAMSALFPGYLGMSWIVMTIINASIALAVLNRLKVSTRPKSAMSDLALPDRMSWFLIAAAALTLVGSLSDQGEMAYIGRNLVMILGLPFFFLGLAVVHNLARTVPYPGVLLTVFYVVLLLSGWVALAVIAAGLMEQWAGIRRHFKTPDQGQV